MSITTFNTAKFQERLIKAKVDPAVAKAQADVLYEAMSQNVDSLATKETMNKGFENMNIRFEDQRVLFKELFANLSECLKLDFETLSETVKSTERQFFDFKKEMKKDFQVFESKMDAKLNKQIIILGGILIASQAFGLTILFFLLNK